jgi:Na+-transporting NADH:ubiquinone oxidoreductase subunit C
MTKEKKSFSETRAYPVIFMIIISFIFIGILATFYHLTYEKVNSYRQLKLKQTIMAMFDLQINDLDADFGKYISLETKNGLNFYKAKQDSLLLGYCFPITGKGLWGKIDALIALDPELEKIIKLEIIEQNETPGLGGRITESWFKDQFKNKTVFFEDKIVSFQLTVEGEATAADEIDQITGATASSKAVIDMIRNNIEKIINKTKADL